jgi:hypothetical protein
MQSSFRSLEKVEINMGHTAIEDLVGNQYVLPLRDLKLRKQKMMGGNYKYYVDSYGPHQIEVSLDTFNELIVKVILAAQ